MVCKPWFAVSLCSVYTSFYSLVVPLFQALENRPRSACASQLETGIILQLLGVKRNGVTDGKKTTQLRVVKSYMWILNGTLLQEMENMRVHCAAVKNRSTKPMFFLVCSAPVS